MADDLTCLQASWKAYRLHITRLYHKINDSLDTEVDDYTVTTLRTTIDQLNDKKMKIAKLNERISALITDPNKLTKVMIDAGDLEDSITDKIAKTLRFIELQTQVKVPQSNPVSKSNTISQPSAVNTEPPQLLSSPVQPISIVSTQALEISSDPTPQNAISIVSNNPISSTVSLTSMPTVSTATTMPPVSTPLLSSMIPATVNTRNIYSKILAPRTVINSMGLASHKSLPWLMPSIPEPASHIHALSQSLNSLFRNSHSQYSPETP